MPCPICGAWCRLVIEPNGKVYWDCPVCDFTQKTKLLSPAFYEEWRDDVSSKED